MSFIPVDIECTIYDIGSSDAFYKVKDKLIGKKVRVISIDNTHREFISARVENNQELFKPFVYKNSMNVLLYQVKFDGPLQIYEKFNTVRIPEWTNGACGKQVVLQNFDSSNLSPPTFGTF